MDNFLAACWALRFHIGLVFIVLVGMCLAVRRGNRQPPAAPPQSTPLSPTHGPWATHPTTCRCVHCR